MPDSGPSGLNQYQFDDLSIDTGKRLVLRDTSALEISGLTYDLLLAIVQASPNIISADELVEKVWSGRPTSPETITQRAMMLRQALGDSADAPRYIEVVRGHGFRLIPEITKDAPVPKAPTSNSRMGYIAAAAIAIAAIFIVKDFVGTSTNDAANESATPEPVRRYEMDLGDLISIWQTGSTQRSDIALSPDGSQLVYVGRYSGESTAHLYLRAMNQLDSQLMEGTEGARHPFFSPDGEWIGFNTSANEIQKMSVRGGLQTTITDDISLMFGATWSEDGSIVYSTTISGAAPTGKLVRISANGGTPEDILVPDGREGFRWPHFLPGGQFLLFSIGAQGNLAGGSDVALLSLESGEHRTLITDGYNAKYSPTGHIVFMRGDTIWAVPFDEASGKVSGEESPLFDGLEHNSGPGEVVYDFSDNGLLVYQIGGDAVLDNHGARYPVWVDRDGNEEPVNVPPATYWAPRISPDGKRAVVVINDDNNNDVWVIDLERETSSRLTFGDAFNGPAFWSPDGDRIIYSSRNDAGGIFSRAANGTGSAEQINVNDIATQMDALSPDGKQAIVLNRGRGESDMYLLSLTGESFPQSFVSTPFDEAGAQISPDGNYVAYESDETGRVEVYVRTFPNPDGGRWQITTDGGYEPQWSPTGNELFFRKYFGSSISAVNIQTEPNFSMTSPRLVIAGNYVAAPFTYAVSADGERLLMFKSVDQPSDETPSNARAPRLAIVENWFEELKRITPSD
jgi:Tol biopolymer transport system component/DNA-binding winged helix-turn-helix (wHTH) protein